MYRLDQHQRLIQFKKAKMHNDTITPISLIANSQTTVSTPEQPQLQLQPQLKPQPCPCPQPVKKSKERNISPTHSNQDKSPSTPAWHPRRQWLWEHATSPEHSGNKTPLHQAQVPSPTTTPMPPIMSPHAGPSLPLQCLRFHLELIIHVFSEEGEESPPPSPTRPTWQCTPSWKTGASTDPLSITPSAEPAPQVRQSSQFKTPQSPSKSPKWHYDEVVS